jgi:hypothetical protein
MRDAVSYIVESSGRLVRCTRPHRKENEYLPLPVRRSPGINHSNPEVGSTMIRKEIPSFYD